jgi:hypothetical protein
MQKSDLGVSQVEFDLFLWLGVVDSNHGIQIQSLLSYH